MRIELLPRNLNYYKANLHSHSTLSDGCITPEQMKAAYKAQGYSVLAITDHNVFIPHNDLTEDDFLMLNGLEYNADPGDGSGRTCHFCAIAGSQDTVIQPLFHREKYCIRGAVEARKFVKYDESLPDYERVYSAEGISEMMKACRDAGFFVTYNHPCWSLERYPEYMGYEGMHAMEIVNYACVAMGYPEVNETVFDDMLTGGKRELSYKAITDALFSGNYYASTGAEISAIYIEDGILHVEAPACKEIRVFTGARKAWRKIGTADAPLTEAAFKLDNPCRYDYVRVTVTDFDENQAFSQAYYTADLGLTKTMEFL